MSRQSELAQLGRVFDNSALSNRNKIINGAMVIDQRNAGASVAFPASTGGAYTLDRFGTYRISAGAYTVQQSTNAPAGFHNSAVFTVTTADATVAANDVLDLAQSIEGYNVADLNWGTANAATVTLSFWVRGSLTGTYCVGFRNGGGNRSYVAEYTINVANTWEYKTITVAGDTTGTWAKDNTTGLIVDWVLTAGSTFQTAPNAWTAGNLIATSNQVNFMATSGATWQITGVQLEAGDTATPFEHRSYGQELALCQRYYEVVNMARTTGVTYTPNGDTRGCEGFFKVAKRSIPTLSYTGSMNVIAVGDVGVVTNVDLGTIGLYSPAVNKFAITSISNYAAFSSAGITISWGDNGGGAMTVFADAEL